MRLALAPVLALAFTALPALAQDREGNDTPGDWRVKHFETFGDWTSSCDERDENGTLVQRCYIRLVDVFSPRPKFGAIFVFVTPDAPGMDIDFGMEAGTLFAPGSFRVERDGDTVWSTLRPGCLTGLSCTFTGDDAAELLDTMAEGGAMRLTFRDRHLQSQDLTWSLEGFGDAMEDFRRESAARGLLPGA